MHPSISHTNKQEQRIHKIIDAFSGYLQYMSEIGIDGFNCSETSLKKIEQWNKRTNVKKQEQIINKYENDAFENILADIKKCNKCSIKEKDSNIFLGEGNKNAKIVFIKDYLKEYTTEINFLEDSEILLTKMILAMGLTREEVYICNVVKCSPINEKQKIQNNFMDCKLFLNRQLNLIKPDAICSFGEFSAQLLLNNRDKIDVLRGRFYNYNNIKLLPTYHPLYLLKNTDKKRATWSDLKKVMNFLGLNKLNF